MLISNCSIEKRWTKHSSELPRLKAVVSIARFSDRLHETRRESEQVWGSWIFPSYLKVSGSTGPQHQNRKRNSPGQDREISAEIQEMSRHRSPVVAARQERIRWQLSVQHEVAVVEICIAGAQGVLAVEEEEGLASFAVTIQQQ
mmetsp:Transcript_118702/g.209831  ORF Transcript_118702/g.209831 Transcript_118702/m.209831 type:complete len:144 (+) Transcript_118702:197-628(+)